MSTIVGRPVPRVDGRDKVTGAAAYAADAQVRGALHGFLVLSTVARGRITRLDTGEAERAPGVVAVFTHRTMPRLKLPTHVSFIKKVLPLQDADVHHSGQTVAFVVAETQEQAQHAATLVKVSYDTRTPHVVLADAMDEAYLPPPGSDGPNEITRGDPAKGFAQADVRVDVTYTTPMHHHNPMEPFAVIADWEGERLTLHESTQGVTVSQACVAEALGVPLENVRVLSPYLGGGFGAKGPWPSTILAAAVARELKRPVKLVLTRAHTYTAHGHRAEGHQRLRIGARQDGTITAIDHESTQQTSRTEERSLYNHATATRLLHACPNLHIAQRAVRLDLPVPAYIRAPEAMAAHGLESALDELAYGLDMDPVELRLRNSASVNYDTGEPWASKHLDECYRRGAAAFRWSERDPRPGSMRDGDTRIGQGMAAIAHTAGGIPGSAARVEISTKGKATVQSATHDLGTGTYTVMTQVAARLKLEDVDFDLGDTAYPYASISGASSTVPSVGAAVNRVCTKARKELIDLAVSDERSPLYGAPAGWITAEGGELYVTDRPRRRDSVRAVLTRHGKPLKASVKPAEETPAQYATGAVFAEVRVDPRLGRVRVTRMLGAFDPGRVLSRRTLRSQVIGSFVWAIGFTFTEHTLVDPHLGRIVNPNLSGYLMPVNADIPEIQALFVDKPDPTSQALGARGFGQAPMAGATAALGNAVYHATGHRVRDLPLTQDKIIQGVR
jgi:xanthine dehydrogenase YagR molybdenum-binding subunit